MAAVAVREPRNDTSGVLSRVEAGEHVRITVSGRAVADMIPLPQRRPHMSWTEFAAACHQRPILGWPLDLAELIPDPTDDEFPE